MSAPLDDPLLQGRVAVSLIAQKLGTALEEMAVKLERLRIHSDRIDAVRAHSEALEHDVEQLVGRVSKLEQCAEPASAASLLAAINDLAAKVEQIETRGQRDVGSHAQAAYETFCVSAGGPWIDWKCVDDRTRVAWMAVARSARAAD